MSYELKKWFQEKKRSFPWRENPTPYAVWISEIMLQQTRASVVIQYFLRWMEKFPTVELLAQASSLEVMKAWEGLGYYSRARNIHEAAKSFVDGVIPSSLNDLLQVKGIGAYTAGAILSFAYHQKAPAVDGNVARVISRFFGIEGDLTSSSKKKELEEKTMAFLPDSEPWIVMEALIELGASICQKRPFCEKCPLRSGCFAFSHNKTEEIPFVKKRKQISYLHKQVAIIFFENEVLLEVKESNLFAGLAQFPSFLYSIEKDLESQIKESLNLEVLWRGELPKEKQSYTTYQEDLFPFCFDVFTKRAVPGFIWYKIEEILNLPFSSGHKRILCHVMKYLESLE